MRLSFYSVPRAFLLVRILAIGLCGSACGGARVAESPAPSAEGQNPGSVSAQPIEQARPPLAPAPTGALEPIQLKGSLELVASAYHVQDGVETFRFDIPEGTFLRDIEGKLNRAVVRVSDPALATVLAFAVQPESVGASGTVHRPDPTAKRAQFENDDSAKLPAQIWLRRLSRVQAAEAPLHVEVYAPASVDASEQFPGYHAELILRPQRLGQPSPGLFTECLRALGDRSPPDSPVRWLLGAAPVGSEGGLARQDTEQELWGRMLQASTGYASIEAALQSNHVLRARRSKERAMTPLATLSGPQLARHPWAQMQSSLPDRPTLEPLAQFAPADFYFVRSKSFSSLEGLLGQLDEVLTPAFESAMPRAELLNLSQRYRLELGVPQSGISSLLGPALVQEVALVGSDPFIRTGSDLTLIVATRNKAALLGALEFARQNTERELKVTEVRYQGQPISIYQSADGRVRQHLTAATVNGEDLVAISNSEAALRRVLDVWAKRSPALAREPDLSYMLARDAKEPNDVLAFAGDSFIAASMSPGQRILDARRQLARADLLRASYSELLYRLVYGRAVTQPGELLKAPWFKREHQTHVTGEPLEVVPGRGASSVFGSPERPTSLIDLPRIERVTVTEAHMYAELSANYQQIWGERIDPIAVRTVVGQRELDFHLRVLPVAKSGDYEDILRFSGGGTTTRGASLPGVAAILALGSNSPARQMLTSQGRGLLGQAFELDWLGDSMELGLADQPALWDVAREASEVPLPPGAPRAAPDTDLSRLAQLPLYFMIDVKSLGGAALFLTGLRKLASDAAPDVVKWGEFKKIDGVTVVQVEAHDLTLYYALTDTRLVFAFSPDVLGALLKPGVVRPEARPVGGQLNVEVRPDERESALFLALAWLVEAGVWRSGRGHPLAELLLWARPELGHDEKSYREASLALFGAVPITPDGRPYTLGEEGWVDPARGSAFRPMWPKLPVMGSPLAHLFQVLSAVRAGLAIDREPGTGAEQSLRTRVHVQLK